MIYFQHGKYSTIKSFKYFFFVYYSMKQIYNRYYQGDQEYIDNNKSNLNVSLIF